MLKLKRPWLKSTESKNSLDLKDLTSKGDIEFRGTLYVGDYTETFEMGPVVCEGNLKADALNAGDVFVTGHFCVRTANVECLNCAGDVEAEYLSCELGAYVLGNLTVDCLVSETHHVFCGGKFTGNFVGDSKLLHQNFNDWSKIKQYI